jgi:tRNA(Ile)-lysidine synthase
VLKSLEQYLRKHRLIHPGERLGVAVSGGADSVALLRALAGLAPSLGVVPFVLHLNHNLRGADSEADERFVRELASQLALDCSVESEDVAALASRLHLSLEAAGRRARYAFFQRAGALHRLDSVATAHTRDDQAETVLLRLLRGTGTSGLSGIHRAFDLSSLALKHPPHPAPPHPPLECPALECPTLERPALERLATQPSPPIRIIRPLLSTTRQQVETFLHSLGQPFQQDASNLSPLFLRNRVRAELLPALEREYNPRLRQALCETAEVAAAENAFLDELVSSTLGPGFDCESGVELKLLQAQPLALQRRILRHLCRALDLALDFAHLESLREFALAARAERLKLPRGFVAEVVREKFRPPQLFVRAPEPERLAATEYFLDLPVPGTVPISAFLGQPNVQIRATLLHHDAALSAYGSAALLSAKRVASSLSVRNLLTGDRYHPLSFREEKKVNRLLQELSVPAALRAGWPIVLCAHQIVWIPGLPVASPLAWTPEDGDAIALELCCSGDGSGAKLPAFHLPLFTLPTVTKRPND